MIERGVTLEDTPFGERFGCLLRTPPVHRYIRYILCGMWMACCASMAAGQAPQSCSPNCALFANEQTKVGSIHVRVRAKRGDAPPNQFQWVLETFPAEGQLELADAGVKQRIQQAINAIQAATPVCGFGANAPGNCRFNEKLEQQLNDPTLTFIAPDMFDTAPTQEGGFDCVLCVLYPAAAPITPPTPQFQAVIAIKTLATRREPVYAPHQLGEANDSASAPAFPVRLAFAQADVDNALADKRLTTAEQARQRVTQELLKAAGEVFARAVKRQLLDASGKVLAAPGTDEFRARQGELKNELTALFDLQQGTDVSWGIFDVFISPCCQTGAPPPGSPCENLCLGAQQPTLILMVAGLQIIRGVSIKVMPDDLDRQYVGTETGRALQKKRKEAEKGLNELFKDKLEAKPGSLVTRTEVECDRKKLCKESLGCADPAPDQCETVKAFQQLSSRPRIPPDQVTDEHFSTQTNLVYQVLRRMPADREITLKGGGSYSAEEKFLAHLGLAELNMLRFGEQLSLDFARGPEVQKVQFQFSRPFQEAVRAGWRLKDVGADVNYFRDKDQRFGNLTPDEIAARATGSRARLSFGYDSFARGDYFLLDCEAFNGRRRTHWTLTGEAALEYRDVTIPESDELLAITGLDRALLPAPNTQVADLALDLTAGVSHDFRRPQRAGLGQATFWLDAKLQRGLDLFGADYVYGKASVAAHGEVFFGALSPQDFFLRYSRGVARGTDRTPVFELFRLGGPANVRGLEEGEFIGRRLTFEQTEFGVNVLALWHLARGTKAPELNRTPCSETSAAPSQQALPFDPANLYLKGFFDRARISDPTSFVRPPGAGTAGGPPFPFDRQANGYGFAVELRNLSGGDGGPRLNLSIGYARSPQSQLHRSGTLFTGVTFTIY